MKKIFNAHLIPLATVFWGIFFLTNFGCKYDRKVDVAQASDIIRPSPDALPPEVHLYWVKMDKMRLRDAPSSKGKVLHQFAKGDFVEGTGKVSSHRETIEINQISYDRPWVEVVSFTPAQKKGWLFEAGLMKIYAGAKAVAPDLGRLAQFSQLLKTLDTRKIQSGKTAWDFLHTHHSETHGTLADALFLMLEEFLNEIHYKQNPGINFEQLLQPSHEDWDKIYSGDYDMTQHATLRQIAAAGFRLAALEGDIFIMPDLRLMNKFFESKVTPPMKKYIQQIAVEQIEPESHDAGLIIPLDKLAARAIFWEGFVREHPYFLLAESVRKKENWYRWMCVVGLDNTPMFDFETNELMPEAKNHYDEVLKKYPGSKLAADVKTFSNLVASQGGKKTDVVDKWMENYASTMLSE